MNVAELGKPGVLGLAFFWGCGVVGCSMDVEKSSDLLPVACLDAGVHGRCSVRTGYVFDYRRDECRPHLGPDCPEGAVFSSREQCIETCGGR